MRLLKKMNELIRFLSIRTRFLVMNLAILVIIAYLVYKIISLDLSNQSFADDEKQALKIYTPLIQLLHEAYKIESKLLTKSPHGEVDLSFELTQWDKNIALIADKSFSIGVAKLDGEIKDLVDFWSLKKANIKDQNLEKSIKTIVAMITKTETLMEDYANYSNLSLDRDATTYALMNLFAYKVPSLLWQLSIIHQAAWSNLADTDPSEAQIKIISALGLYNFIMDQTKVFIDNLAISESSLQKDLSIIKAFPDSKLIDSQAKLFFGAAQSKELAAYQGTLNQSVETFMKIHASSLNAFQVSLDHRLSANQQDMFVSMGITAIFFILLWALNFSVYSSIMVTIRYIIDFASSLQSGSLVNNLKFSCHDEFKILIDALNKMQIKLLNVVKEIKSSTTMVSSGSHAISKGNFDLSKRTEEQATSLAATAASMEEISVTIKDNAAQTSKAAEFAEKAHTQAEQSGQVMTEAVGAMNAITTSSKKIAEIISVIDSIAFQTNLLALNAAVEAARAGDQGKGFAVVAAEVRNLSQRCATAAKEINDLINASVASIEEGSYKVNKSGESLQAIFESTAEVKSLVIAIANATREQSIGLEEINKSVVQIDGITQQNTALVEETASASEQVSQHSQELMNLLAFFIIDESSATKDSVSTSKLTDVPLKNSTPSSTVQSGQMPDDDDWKEF